MKRVIRRMMTVVAATSSAIICLAHGNLADEAAWRAFTGSRQPDDVVAYVPNGAANQSLEIYLPPEATEGKPAPVLLFVHGGGWIRGTRSALAAHARYFAARGWVCVNISYRLTSEPGVTLADQQADVRAAFEWVHAHASRRGWDRERISALGESAGGQLVCALGVLPPETGSGSAHSLVLVNPVLDLTKLPWALTTPGVRDAALASPLLHLTSEAPPILLLHGRKDVTVPVAQAEAFAAKAKSVGADVRLIVLENAEHAFLLEGFGDPAGIRNALGQIAEYLDSER